MPNKPCGDVRRRRKRQAAYVFRYRCAYCRRRFRTLDDATLDHIVPRCLWHTWSTTALALACPDCNHRKGDRFPLSIALLLAARHPVHAFTVARSSVHAGPTVPAANEASVHGGAVAFTRHTPVFTPPLTLAVWRLLARIAYVNQSALPFTQRFTSDLPESTSHEQIPERTAA
ncbi:HNH endonuclease [Streptomyces werraensis]|uniref:HNH endonuclease n=1 Tax=Streptomyces werraensis TaxID=68284 RepID=UPI001CE301B5